MIQQFKNWVRGLLKEYFKDPEDKLRETLELFEGGDSVFFYLRHKGQVHQLRITVVRIQYYLMFPKQNPQILFLDFLDNDGLEEVFWSGKVCGELKILTKAEYFPIQEEGLVFGQRYTTLSMETSKNLTNREDSLYPNQTIKEDTFENMRKRLISIMKASV